MLASDDNNPAFVNPKDPDAILQVSFYDYKALDQWASREKGEKVYLKEYPYVRIAVPGDANTIIERPAQESDKRRFPNQWLYYEMQTGKTQNIATIGGWPIEEWAELNPDQVIQLKYMRFFMVEQIAGASDAQVQNFMGGAALREKALQAVRAKNGLDARAALAERDEKIKGLEGSIEQMKAMMQQLMAAQGLKPVDPPSIDPEGSDSARETMGLPKRGPGRPRSEATA